MTSEFRWKAAIYLIFITILLGVGAYLRAIDSELINIVYLIIIATMVFGTFGFYLWVYVRLVNKDARPWDVYGREESRLFAFVALFFTMVSILTSSFYPLLWILVLIALARLRMWFIRRRLR